MLIMGSPSFSPSLSLSPSLSPHSCTFPSPNPNLFLRSYSSFTPLTLRSNQTRYRFKKLPSSNAPNFLVAASAKAEPLKVIISGAPASGKGTQCELITQKYGLVHIAAGDLLRAEVAAASENGKLAKEYMEKGELVPNKIVVMMVKERLLQPDSQQRGWLLDGYPRSSSQAAALEDYGIRPDVFILLDVSEDILVERVVGRRLDPLTGKIYHLKYSPPENDEIASRLTQRCGYAHIIKMWLLCSLYIKISQSRHVNGNEAKEHVFAQIDAALTHVGEQRKVNSGSVAA
ncbi:hypothetical protein CXB51_010873 [Gossypium anomalum]|uniref:adenylate kinase n=1 Tax=Gossypium anomalum TaxID=47600 RepID=A0A8J5ZDU5_9ROSI|nr:hypothetical protein CXB51_010873 [Gossypium anomalum]